MKAINPMGPRKAGGEYQSDMLQLNYSKVPVPGAVAPKSAMVDGPYGGKKPQSGK